MDISTFNYLEAGLWLLVAVGMVCNGALNKAVVLYRKNLYISAVWFVLFAISDLIEAHTGAWWKPIGLILLKAICIVGFGYCFVVYMRIRRGSAL
jgi:nitrate reductase NapE component